MAQEEIPERIAVMRDYVSRIASTTDVEKIVREECGPTAGDRYRAT